MRTVNLYRQMQLMEIEFWPQASNYSNDPEFKFHDFKFAFSYSLYA